MADRKAVTKERVGFKAMEAEFLRLPKEVKTALLKSVNFYFPRASGNLLYFLDGDFDGFYACLFKTDDYVAITIMMPKQEPVPELAESNKRLQSALTTILTMGLYNMSPYDKKKVILHFIERDNYFGKKRSPDLTPMLTKIMNLETIKGETRSEYTGTKSSDGFYLFEQPYRIPMLLDTSDKCDNFKKVDLSSPKMRSAKAIAFFRRLAHDLTLCRGHTHVQSALKIVEKPVPPFDNVLYLMFRNRVPEFKWWKNLTNVTYVCAAIKARIDREESDMYLEAICSRPGTTGVVEEMLQRISADALDTYRLDSLSLIPDNNKLAKIYTRPQYGFVKRDDEDDMVKYLTDSALAKAQVKAAEEEEVNPHRVMSFAPVNPRRRGKDVSLLPEAAAAPTEDEFEGQGIQKRQRTGGRKKTSIGRRSRSKLSKGRRSRSKPSKGRRSRSKLSKGRRSRF
jgi:hypothetical protein